MRDERANAVCSACGQETRREDMFGAEPDLICEQCADRIRERTAPKATGRIVSTFVSGSAPVTIAVVAVSALLYLLGREKTFPILSMLQVTEDGRDLLHSVHDQPWRMLTSAFLHGGFLHVLFNVYAMWFFGRVVELRWGSLVMASIFLGGAVLGGAAAWLFEWYAVGISGAIFALAAFLFSLRRVDQFAGAVMNPRLTRMLIAWLILGVVLSAVGASGLRMSNWGHGGGVAFGLIAGLAWRFGRHWALCAVTVLLVAVSVIAVMNVFPPFWLR